MKTIYIRFLTLLCLFTGLAYSCNKFKEKRIRNADIIEVVVIDHESASVKVSYNIKENENATVGLRWVQFYGIERVTYYEEIFTQNDTIIEFNLNELYADNSYSIETYINTYENMAHSSESFATRNFHTADVPSTPCSVNSNEVILNGSSTTANSFFFQDYPHDYTINFDVGPFDIAMIFEDEPFSGVFTTTKSAESFGPKYVRIEAKYISSRYRCLTDKKIYVVRDKGDISVSFCDLVLVRYDIEGDETLTLSGEANNL